MRGLAARVTATRGQVMGSAGTGDYLTESELSFVAGPVTRRGVRIVRRTVRADARFRKTLRVLPTRIPTEPSPSLMAPGEAHRSAGQPNSAATFAISDEAFTASPGTTRRLGPLSSRVGAASIAASGRVTQRGDLHEEALAGADLRRVYQGEGDHAVNAGRTNRVSSRARARRSGVEQEAFQGLLHHSLAA